MLAASVFASPADAQEDSWGAEGRRLAGLAPERVGDLERTSIRAGVQPHGYPALEAEYEAPGGTLYLFVLYEAPEEGQLQGMLSAALERERAEPWDLRDLEAWKMVDPGAAGPESGTLQRLVRVEAEDRAARDAWVLAAGPDGSGAALDALMEGLELERLGVWAVEFGSGGGEG